MAADLDSSPVTRAEVDEALTRVLLYMRENMLATVSIVAPGRDGITAHKVPYQTGVDVAGAKSRPAKHLA